MKKFLDRLVDLSGLRDRDELEFALVMLIGHCDQWTLQSTHLVRAIGHLEDQRWLSRARLSAGQTHPTRDLVWSDWTTLPKLADFPLRQAARIQQAHGGEHIRGPVHAKPHSGHPDGHRVRGRGSAEG